LDLVGSVTDDSRLVDEALGPIVEVRANGLIDEKRMVFL
jgi:hypothetical protein